MPRQDVPYGGTICRLKERIAEIWDKLGEKLHSINGVEGDGAGDVKIVSGDPAVVINSDAAQNEIEIALDTLRLPNGAVRPQVYVATIPQTDYLDVCQVQFMRIGLDKGLLSLSGHMRDISLPDDVWTLISIDTIMTAMGLTHKRPSSYRSTGWWHYNDGGDHGDMYGSGTVCQVSPSGGLELGRYYSGTDIGNWEMSVLGRDRYISVRDVYVEIEIPPDDSKRPIGTVSSVNGKTGAAATGAVALDAGDIPSNGNSNVQADIDAGKTAIRACTADIIAERDARQNADAALQTKINAVQAGIPGAAAAAVAADPTVAQLAREVPNKVDKITGGSTKRAYTHTGSVQDDTPVVNGTDANSIALRDANGRMRAADPAAGATDKTLVTANWVSQTGDSAPNNLVHKTGNELILNRKTFTEFSQAILNGKATFSNDTPFFKLGHIDRHMNALINIRIGGGYTSNCDSIDIMFNTFNTSSHFATYKMRRFNTTNPTKVYIAYNASASGFDIWVSMADGVTWVIVNANICSYGYVISNTFITDGSLTPMADPSADYTNFSEIPVIN